MDCAPVDEDPSRDKQLPRQTSLQHSYSPVQSHIYAFYRCSLRDIDDAVRAQDHNGEERRDPRSAAVPQESEREDIQSNGESSDPVRFEEDFDLRSNVLDHTSPCCWVESVGNVVMGGSKVLERPAMKISVPERIERT